MKKNPPRAVRLDRKLLSLAVASCFAADLALANPTAPTVVHGNAAFQQHGNVLQITNSPNTVINWGSFSIEAGEITRFVQQSAGSAVLNRVTGQNPSSILGALLSNGRVFLINPSGIVFGAGAQVDVAGLVASTLNLSNADFLAGRLRFTEVAGAGSIANAGGISTGSGGSVYLVAPDITNSGIITSPKGEVVLAAGRSVELVDPGTPNLRVEVSAPDNAARNLGTIAAESGRIGIYAGLIEHSGTLRADSAVLGENGRILLKATQAATLESGSLISASGPNGGTIEIDSGDTSLVSGAIEAKGSAGSGGTVHVLGHKVGLVDDANIDTSGSSGGGTVLIGGDYQGANPAVRNAWRTYFGPDATIRADGVTNGDGGKVIVWSDDATRAYGTISAKAGTQGGDGGFIETSGAHLDVTGLRIDAAAAAGKGGVWLLDPSNITIDAGLPDLNIINIGNVFESTSADSILSTTTLLALLNIGVNVVVQTGALGGQAGDITINSPITKSGLNATLTLNAHNNININASITSTAGQLDIVLAPDFDTNGTGAVNLGTATLNANGGTINAAGKTVNVSGGTATVDSAFTVGKLVLSGGTLAGSGAVSVTDMVWSGGTLTGSGAFTVANSLDLDGVGTKVLDVRTFTDNATTSWDGTGLLRLQNGAVFTNNGAFTVSGDFTSDVVNGGTFVNASTGVFTKSGGTGTSIASAGFDNSGTVDVNAGTLKLAGGGSDSGTFNVGAAGTLEFGGGAHTLTAASALTGAGDVKVSNGTVHIDGAYTVNGALNVTGGTATLDVSANVPMLALSGGTLTGSGDVSATDMVWSGGTLTGSGEFTVANSLDLDGAGTKVLDARSFTNDAATTWDGTGVLRLANGAVFTNNGAFTVTGDFTTDAVNAGTFLNAATGVFTKSGGAGTSVVSAAFDNSGTVNGTAGTLKLAGGGSDSGTFNVGAAGRLEFGGGVHSLAAASTLAGDGSVKVSNGTVHIDGAYTVRGALEVTGGTANFNVDASLPLLTVTGGTLAGSGDLGVTDMAWSGGTLAGSGAFTVTDSLDLGGAGTKILDGRSFTDSGSTAWDGTGLLQLKNKAVFANSGAFTVSGDFTIDVLNGGTFVNEAAGAFTKSGGAGTSTVRTTFDNTGTLTVKTGTLALDGALSQTGSIEVAAGATLRKTGGFTNSGTLRGAGTVEVGAGNALINDGTVAPGVAGTGTLAIAGDFQQGSAGALSMEIGGTDPGAAMNGYDQLAVSGSAKLDGTLDTRLVNGFVPAAGSKFDVVQAGAAISGAFAGTNLPVLPDVELEVASAGSTVSVQATTILPSAAQLPPPPQISDIQKIDEIGEPEQWSRRTVTYLVAPGKSETATETAVAPQLCR